MSRARCQERRAGRRNAAHYGRSRQLRADDRPDDGRPAHGAHHQPGAVSCCGRRGARSAAPRRRAARRRPHSAPAARYPTAAGNDRQRLKGDGLMMRVVALLWLGGVAAWNGASAQVGHEPAHSPYHDVRRGGVVVFTVGYLGGSRGSVGVGPSHGKTGGIRYEVPFGAVGASLALAYARMARFVVDPFKDTTSRKTGPFTDDVVLLDAGLQLILTVRKTWRRLRPYVGGALGVGLGGTAPPGPGGCKSGAKCPGPPH